MTATIRTGDGRTFATCTDCLWSYGPSTEADATDRAAEHVCKETP